MPPRSQNIEMFRATLIRPNLLSSIANTKMSYHHRLATFKRRKIAQQQLFDPSQLSPGTGDRVTAADVGIPDEASLAAIPTLPNDASHQADEEPPPPAVANPPSVPNNVLMAVRAITRGQPLPPRQETPPTSVPVASPSRRQQAPTLTRRMRIIGELD